jgi:uncharacterized protein
MKKLLSIFVFCLVLICVPINAYAYNNPDLPRIVDKADLLTKEQKRSLRSKIDEVSEKYDFDIVIVTVNSTNGKSAMEYADDYYDYKGYGCGEDNDGCLYLVDMGNREFWLSTTGYGITALTDYGIEYVNNEALPYLSGGDYYNAFDTVISEVDSLVGQAKDGTPYDIDSDYDYSSNYNESYSDSIDREEAQKTIIGCFIISVIIAIVVVLSIRKSYKPVRFNSNANSYIVPGSMHMSYTADNFLYTTTSRTRIQSDSSSSGGHSGGGGGSSTHTSSSGTTHGGGGGHF